MSFRHRTVLIAVSAVACLSAAAVHISTSGTHDQVAVPLPDAKVAGYCAALHARLPERLDGHARHDLKPASDLTAGWGDPLIVLRCGVPRPAVDADMNALGADVDGVGWSYEQGQNGSVRLTTTLRKAYVEVVLPAKYAHDTGSLVDLAGVVKQTIPEGI